MGFLLAGNGLLLLFLTIYILKAVRPLPALSPDWRQATGILADRCTVQP